MLDSLHIHFAPFKLPLLVLYHQNNVQCHEERPFSYSHCDKKFMSGHPLKVHHNNHHRMKHHVIICDHSAASIVTSNS